MKGKRSLLAVIIILAALYPALAMGTNASFTDIAQDPASGLHLSDFSMGTAIFDFNNDGFDDIVVTNYSSAPDRLYMSNGNGTFSEVGAVAGIDNQVKTLGIATADLDGTGLMDYLVFTENSYGGGSTGPGMLYLNNGDQTFSDAGVNSFYSMYGYEGYACAFADYNMDGLLDVFYGGRLFRNLGDMQFEESNDAAGLGSIGFVAHAAFADVDNDLDPDLFISRQNGGSASLYLNDGHGHFSDATSHIEGTPYGLGGSFADIDNDGDLDLFLAYSNVLYLNDGSGHFTIDDDANTSLRYTRGAVFADFDNDGDPDLVLANEDGSSTFHENLGGGVFQDVTAEVGMDNQQDKAGGLAVGDLDGDGDLDLYIAKSDYLVNPCFVNNLNNNYAVEVSPRGTVSNFAGIGSKVYLYDGGYLGNANHLRSMYELTSTSGFNAGTNGRIHLGTGGPGLFDVRVVYPAGTVVDTAGVSAGSRLIIFETGEMPNYIRLAPSGISLMRDISDGPVTVRTLVYDAKGESIPWTAASTTSWLTVNTPSGNTPDSLSITVNPDGLGLGQYVGHVQITTPDAINSPTMLVVSVQITDYFLNNVSASVGLNDFDFSNGAAFFDYNLDGFDDIYLNNNNGQNRLYRSDGVSFTDVGEAASVSDCYHNLGVFAGDLDADALPDIITFTEDKEVGYTYMNTGFETFIDAGIQQFSTTLGYDGYAVAVNDVDHDGDLDVFYGARLYRNDGNMTFTDITEEAGLSNIRFVCRAVFGDIDNDGDDDLVINRQNRAVSLMFTNDGTGHFTDISDNSSLGYFPTALGTSFGDVDNDGDLDMYTGAGYSDPNYLFLNDGNGFFTDVTQASGTTCRNYTRGTEFFDVDNDGDLDLVVANENRSAQFFLNDGTGAFTDVTDMCGINDGRAKAGPAVVGDYDGDGDLDVYIARTDYIQNSFFRNETNNGAFITVAPVGVVSNRAGIGTKVYLFPAGQLGSLDALVGYREYNVSNGFNGSGPDYIHFGTGGGDQFDLRTVFPSGVTVDQLGVTPGSRLTVMESGDIPDYLVLSPGSFSFDFLEGDPAAQAQMMIKNSAGNPISWSAMAADGWCQLSSSSGTTDQTITLTVDPTGLTPGNYETTIRVIAVDAINSPRTAVVRMTITADQPILTLLSDRIDFTAVQNSTNPWPKEFSITNTGQGTFDWTLTASGESWMTAQPLSGTAPSNVTVGCFIDSLPVGTYQATITVTAPGALNSPASLTVNLTIIPGDAPERDTVRVASVSAQPGEQIVVPVYLHNVHELAAFSIPLTYDPAILTCDSVSFAGTRIDYIDITESNIDTIGGGILFGMVVFMEDYLQPGDGEIANLYMRVNSEAPEQVSVIDSSFFPPAGQFLLFDPSSSSIYPEFQYGNIFVGLSLYGDANGSGGVEIGDGVYLIQYVFKGQRPPIPINAGDANGDADVNIGDIVYIVDYIFKGGPPPPKAAPGMSAGPVYYTVEKSANADGALLKIMLDSDVPIGGVQFEVPDPAGFIKTSAPVLGGMTRDMQAYSGFTAGSHRFGLCDMSGSGVIPAGQGELLTIPYSGIEAAEIESFQVFDEHGNEIPAVLGTREKTEPLPMQYSLMQNYPNPFNPTTTINYAVPAAGHVELIVFNVLGQKVKNLVNSEQQAGRYSVTWDATDNAGHKVATGIYFYRLKADEFTKTRKMALIK